MGDAPPRAPRTIRAIAILIVFACPLALTATVRAEDAPSSSPPPQPPQSAELPPEAGELLETGRALWEQFAPDELKQEYGFPSVEDAQKFLAALENDLAEGSIEKLAAYEPEAKRALALLRQLEGGEALADWLQPRLDLLTAAVEMQTAPPPPPSEIKRAAPTRPGTKPSTDAAAPRSTATPNAGRRPQYTRAYWERTIASRPPPPQAKEIVPRLKKVFREEGIAPEFVWIAEVESSMNPRATSPAGARGLFQFMPATAQRFGLSTRFPDERTDPEKSARAAASYLRLLHARFKSWPLAVAAYNAGEGRVDRALAASDEKTFEAVAEKLSPETRLYVPKVFATVAARESVDAENLPAPASTAAALSAK